MSDRVCVVIGVGPKNGASIAKKFSDEGYKVAVLARSVDYVQELASSLKDAKGYVCDVTNVEMITNVFQQIKSELGSIHTLVYNAGGGQFIDFDETTVEILEKNWEINVRGCFAAAKQAVPDMRETGGGNIIVIGATASLRGKATALPFASAKSAQRIMLESMARKLGPEGIHVGYLILDGFVFSDFAKGLSPDKADEDFIHPEAVAEGVYYLSTQPRTTWTFEMILRPSREDW